MKASSALLFFHSAHSYAFAAATLSSSEREATHTDAVIRFLYAHASELYLKSYLLAKGLSLEAIKKDYGHNLVELLKEAKERGALFSSEADETLRIIWEAGYSFADRYLERGFRQVMLTEHLHGTCKELHNVIGDPIYKEQDISRRLDFPTLSSE